MSSNGNLIGQIEVLKGRLDSSKKRLRKQREKFELEAAERRVHYGNVVAKYMAELCGARNKIDSLTTSALQDHFKLNDYEGQQAVYLKQNAELSHDLQKLTKLYKESGIHYNDMFALKELYRKDLIELDRQLIEAKKKFGYRLWMAITIRAAALRMAITTKLSLWKQRASIKWKIWRLSKERIAALYEAGHVPDKLVKSALAYYEHDKARMEIDEQIREIHSNGDRTTVIREQRPSLWRRWNIWLGRA